MLQISLWNLINRLEANSRRLNEYPDNADMLTRHIEATKSAIIECVLQNKDHPAFKGILMR